MTGVLAPFGPELSASTQSVASQAGRKTAAIKLHLAGATARRITMRRRIHPLVTARGACPLCPNTASENAGRTILD